MYTSDKMGRKLVKAKFLKLHSFCMKRHILVNLPSMSYWWKLFFSLQFHLSIPPRSLLKLHPLLSLSGGLLRLCLPKMAASCVSQFSFGKLLVNTFQPLGWTETTLELVINSLESYTTYAISVSASTVVGDGPRSVVTLVTTDESGKQRCATKVVRSSCWKLLLIRSLSCRKERVRTNLSLKHIARSAD